MADKPKVSLRKPPAKDKKQTSIYFRPETLRRLGHLSVETGKSMSALVEEAVLKYLDAEKA